MDKNEIFNKLDQELVQILNNIPKEYNREIIIELKKVVDEFFKKIS